jgi:undecaprenyl-diphosphatase
MAMNDKVKVGLSLWLSAAIFGAIALGVFLNWTTAFDLGLSRAIYSLRTPLLTQIMLGATFLGSTPLISTLAIIIFLVFWIKNRKNFAALLALTLLASVALNNFFKYCIHRPRPDISPLINELSYSFPSGHAMNSLVFYGLLAYFAHRCIKNGPWRILINATAIILVIAIGFSRVYLGAHYPADIIAGYAAGIFVLYTAIGIRTRRGDSA